MSFNATETTIQQLRNECDGDCALFLDYVQQIPFSLQEDIQRLQNSAESVKDLSDTISRYLADVVQLVKNCVSGRIRTVTRSTIDLATEDARNDNANVKLDADSWFNGFQQRLQGHWADVLEAYGCYGNVLQEGESWVTEVFEGWVQNAPALQRWLEQTRELLNSTLHLRARYISTYFRAFDSSGISWRKDALTRYLLDNNRLNRWNSELNRLAEPSPAFWNDELQIWSTLFAQSNLPPDTKTTRIDQLFQTQGLARSHLPRPSECNLEQVQQELQNVHQLIQSFQESPVDFDCPEKIHTALREIFEASTSQHDACPDDVNGLVQAAFLKLFVFLEQFIASSQQLIGGKIARICKPGAVDEKSQSESLVRAVQPLTDSNAFFRECYTKFFRLALEFWVRFPVVEGIKLKKLQTAGADLFGWTWLYPQMKTCEVLRKLYWENFPLIWKSGLSLYIQTTVERKGSNRQDEYRQYRDGLINGQGYQRIGLVDVPRASQTPLIESWERLKDLPYEVAKVRIPLIDLIESDQISLRRRPEAILTDRMHPGTDATTPSSAETPSTESAATPVASYNRGSTPTAATPIRPRQGSTPLAMATIRPRQDPIPIVPPQTDMGQERDMNKEMDEKHTGQDQDIYGWLRKTRGKTPDPDLGGQLYRMFQSLTGTFDVLTERERLLKTPDLSDWQKNEILLQAFDRVVNICTHPWDENTERVVSDVHRDTMTRLVGDAALGRLNTIWNSYVQAGSSRRLADLEEKSTGILQQPDPRTALFKSGQVLSEAKSGLTEADRESVEQTVLGLLGGNFKKAFDVRTNWTDLLKLEGQLIKDTEAWPASQDRLIRLISSLAVERLLSPTCLPPQSFQDRQSLLKTARELNRGFEGNLSKLEPLLSEQITEVLSSVPEPTPESLAHFFDGVNAVQAKIQVATANLRNNLRETGNGSKFQQLSLLQGKLRDGVKRIVTESLAPVDDVRLLERLVNQTFQTTSSRSDWWETDLLFLECFRRASAIFQNRVADEGDRELMENFYNTVQRLVQKQQPEVKAAWDQFLLNQTQLAARGLEEWEAIIRQRIDNLVGRFKDPDGLAVMLEGTRNIDKEIIDKAKSQNEADQESFFPLRLELQQRASGVLDQKLSQLSDEKIVKALTTTLQGPKSWQSDAVLLSWLKSRIAAQPPVAANPLVKVYQTVKHNIREEGRSQVADLWTTFLETQSRNAKSPAALIDLVVADQDWAPDLCLAFFQRIAHLWRQEWNAVAKSKEVPVMEWIRLQSEQLHRLEGTGCWRVPAAHEAVSQATQSIHYEFWQTVDRWYGEQQTVDDVMSLQERLVQPDSPFRAGLNVRAFDRALRLDPRPLPDTEEFKKVHGLFRDALRTGNNETKPSIQERWDQFKNTVPTRPVVPPQQETGSKWSRLLLGLPALPSMSSLFSRSPSVPAQNGEAEWKRDFQALQRLWEGRDEPGGWDRWARDSRPIIERLQELLLTIPASFGKHWEEFWRAAWQAVFDGLKNRWEQAIGERFAFPLWLERLTGLARDAAQFFQTAPEPVLRREFRDEWVQYLETTQGQESTFRRRLLEWIDDPLTPAEALSHFCHDLRVMELSPTLLDDAVCQKIWGRIESLLPIEWKSVDPQNLQKAQAMGQRHLETVHCLRRRLCANRSEKARMKKVEREIINEFSDFVRGWWKSSLNLEHLLQQLDVWQDKKREPWQQQIFLKRAFHHALQLAQDRPAPPPTATLAALARLYDATLRAMDSPDEAQKIQKRWEEFQKWVENKNKKQFEPSPALVPRPPPAESNLRCESTEDVMVYTRHGVRYQVVNREGPNDPDAAWTPQETPDQWWSKRCADNLPTFHREPGGRYRLKWEPRIPSSQPGLEQIDGPATSTTFWRFVKPNQAAPDPAKDRELWQLYQYLEGNGLAGKACSDAESRQKIAWFLMMWITVTDDTLGSLRTADDRGFLLRHGMRLLELLFGPNGTMSLMLFYPFLQGFIDEPEKWDIRSGQLQLPVTDGPLETLMRAHPNTYIARLSPTFPMTLEFIQWQHVQEAGSPPRVVFFRLNLLSFRELEAPNAGERCPGALVNLIRALTHFHEGSERRSLHFFPLLLLLMLRRAPELYGNHENARPFSPLLFAPGAFERWGSIFCRDPPPPRRNYDADTDFRKQWLDRLQQEQEPMMILMKAYSGVEMHKEHYERIVEMYSGYLKAEHYCQGLFPAVDNWGDPGCSLDPRWMINNLPRYDRTSDLMRACYDYVLKEFYDGSLWECHLDREWKVNSSRQAQGDPNGILRHTHIWHLVRWLGVSFWKQVLTEREHKGEDKTAIRCILTWLLNSGSSYPFMTDRAAAQVLEHVPLEEREHAGVLRLSTAMPLAVQVGDQLIHVREEWVPSIKGQQHDDLRTVEIRIRVALWEKHRKVLVRSLRSIEAYLQHCNVSVTLAKLFGGGGHRVTNALLRETVRAELEDLVKGRATLKGWAELVEHTIAANRDLEAMGLPPVRDCLDGAQPHIDFAKGADTNRLQCTKDRDWMYGTRFLTLRKLEELKASHQKKKRPTQLLEAAIQTWKRLEQLGRDRDTTWCSTGKRGDRNRTFLLHWFGPETIATLGQGGESTEWQMVAQLGTRPSFDLFLTPLEQQLVAFTFPGLLTVRLSGTVPGALDAVGFREPFVGDQPLRLRFTSVRVRKLLPPDRASTPPPLGLLLRLFLFSLTGMHLAMIDKNRENQACGRSSAVPFDPVRELNRDRLTLTPDMPLSYVAKLLTLLLSCLEEDEVPEGLSQALKGRISRSALILRSIRAHPKGSAEEFREWDQYTSFDDLAEARFEHEAQLQGVNETVERLRKKFVEREVAALRKFQQPNSVFSEKLRDRGLLSSSLVDQAEQFRRDEFHGKAYTGETVVGLIKSLLGMSGKGGKGGAATQQERKEEKKNNNKPTPTTMHQPSRPVGVVFDPVEREDGTCPDDQWPYQAFQIGADGKRVKKCGREAWMSSAPREMANNLDDLDNVDGSRDVLKIIGDRLVKSWRPSVEELLRLWYWLGERCVGHRLKKVLDQLTLKAAYKSANDQAARERDRGRDTEEVLVDQDAAEETRERADEFLKSKPRAANMTEACAGRLRFLLEMMNSGILFPFVPDEDTARKLCREQPDRAFVILDWSDSGLVQVYRYSTATKTIYEMSYRAEELVQEFISVPTSVRLRVFQDSSGALCAHNYAYYVRWKKEQNTGEKPIDYLAWKARPVFENLPEQMQPEFQKTLTSLTRLARGEVTMTDEEKAEQKAALQSRMHQFLGWASKRQGRMLTAVQFEVFEKILALEQRSVLAVEAGHKGAHEYRKITRLAANLFEKSDVEGKVQNAKDVATLAQCQDPNSVPYLRMRVRAEFPELSPQDIHVMTLEQLCRTLLRKQPLEEVKIEVGIGKIYPVPDHLKDPHTGLLDLWNKSASKQQAMNQWLRAHYGLTVEILRRDNAGLEGDIEALKKLGQELKENESKVQAVNENSMKALVRFQSYMRKDGEARCAEGELSLYNSSNQLVKVCSGEKDKDPQPLGALELLDLLFRAYSEPEVILNTNDLDFIRVTYRQLRTYTRAITKEVPHQVQGLRDQAGASLQLFKKLKHEALRCCSKKDWMYIRPFWLILKDTDASKMVEEFFGNALGTRDEKERISEKWARLLTPAPPAGSGQVPPPPPSKSKVVLFTVLLLLHIALITQVFVQSAFK